MSSPKTKPRIQKRPGRAAHGSLHRHCGAVGGDFYLGIEWMACWLLDNVEGETITEEQLRPWAAKAWAAHLKRQNSAVSQHPADA